MRPTILSGAGEPSAMARRPARWLALGLALSAGCASLARPRLAYTADELRQEVARRAPAIDAAERVVPFEVTEEQVALARRAVADARTARERARMLSEALFSPDYFGLRYAWSITAAAQDTLRAAQGNCLSLASVFVGLARAVGLEAYYMDASVRVHETRFGGDGMVVNAGHVTALVKDGDKDIALDFEQLGKIAWYRVLSDVEALAHFYNNRGYDLIDRADEAGQPVDWAEVAHQFELAVEVVPEFAQAWNNLGIAHARQGLRDEAIADYRRAMARDPGLAAARNNLGLLYLEEGEVPAALAALREAARLEPRGSHIQYNLATARLRQGDRPGALEALRRALALRSDYPEARALLAQLTSSAPVAAPHPSPLPGGERE